MKKKNIILSCIVLVLSLVGCQEKRPENAISFETICLFNTKTIEKIAISKSKYISSLNLLNLDEQKEAIDHLNTYYIPSGKNVIDNLIKEDSFDYTYCFYIDFLGQEGTTFIYYVNSYLYILYNEIEYQSYQKISYNYLSDYSSNEDNFSDNSIWGSEETTTSEDTTSYPIETKKNFQALYGGKKEDKAFFIKNDCLFLIPYSDTLEVGNVYEFTYEQDINYKSMTLDIQTFPEPHNLILYTENHTNQIDIVMVYQESIYDMMPYVGEDNPNRSVFYFTYFKVYHFASSLSVQDFANKCIQDDSHFTNSLASKLALSYNSSSCLNKDEVLKEDGILFYQDKLIIYAM